MKRGRKAIDTPCPEGYPFRLYEVNEQFVLAPSKDEVRRKTGIGKGIKTANVGTIISSNGHSKANQILKQYGNRWVCKEGKIFYAP